MAVLPLLADTSSGQIIIDPVTYVFWVHPDRGSDSNPGTQADPWKTLTHALAETAALRDSFPSAPPGSQTVAWTIRIHVQSSATPIAPLGYGGYEPEFPIRLERQVNVLGVNSPVHGKARILIDDHETINYPWPSIPATDGSGTRAFVYGAQNCTLKNFRIDGILLRNKYEPYTSGGEPKKKAVYGVHTVDKKGFHLEDCDLLGQYNGASWFASSGATCSGTVTGCSFQGYYPFPATSSNAAEIEGHGGLWLEGQNGFVPAVPPGEDDPDGFTRVSIQVYNSTFLGSHDGIEIAGPEVAVGQTERFIATLTVDGCIFDGNENGLEVVGRGRLDVSVTASLFHKNIPREELFGGTSMDIVTAGIAVRGMEVVGRVRDSVFRNNAAAVVWNTFSPLACLDLGHAAGETESACFGTAVPTLAAPGLNVFEIDYTDWDPTRDAYTVLLLNRTLSTTIPIHAAGNTWLPGVQGADANGCLSGLVTGPVNFQPPLFPPHWSLGGLVNRNFSIQPAGAQIKFSPACP